MPRNTSNESIRCPHCNCGHCPVVDTEQRTIDFRGKSRTVVRRRRVCRYCKLPFTTIETYESDEVPYWPDGIPRDLPPVKPPVDPADAIWPPLRSPPKKGRDGKA